MAWFESKEKREAKEKAAEAERIQHAEIRKAQQKAEILAVAREKAQREKEQKEKEMADEKAFQKNPDHVFDDDQCTLLQRAIYAEDIKEIKRVLKAGANPDFLGEKTTSNLYNAMSVSSDINIEVTRLMLDAGADPNFKVEDEEETCLYRAVYGSFSNSVEITEMLLEAGANPNTFDYGSESIIYRAYCEGEGKLSLVVKHGADVFLRSNNSDAAVWESALYRFDKQRIDTLVRFTDQKTRLYQEFKKYTKNHWSKDSSQHSSLREIFWRAAIDAENVYQNPEQGQSFFHDMVEQGNVDKVHAILNKHEYQETQNHKSQTPLHIASKENNVALIALLLKKGANPEATDAAGFTALDTLAEQGHLGGFAEQLLKDKGCQYNVLNPDRITGSGKPANNGLSMATAIKSSVNK